MPTLLKRQIRKYLSKELAESKELEQFLDAVARSYQNFDDQYVMQQRAMAISSEELIEVNEQLRKETKAQQSVIDELKRVMNSLGDSKFTSDNNDVSNFKIDGLKLIEHIDNQTKEILQINKQREKLLKELEHQNQELSDYAHMVSHDLKSPLRSIDSLTSWLKEDYDDKLGDNGKQSLDLIRNNVDKMDALINGILEYSTIGKNRVEVYDVDTNKLIDDISESLQVPEHFSILKHHLPVIKADKYRLQQLFQNLITNAFNYNDKEKGKIEIGSKEQEEFWEFYVKDNGKGIEEKYFDKVFNTFEKLENNGKSTGIGLSIVKKIVDTYGGKIWLTSQLNKGTTFYFTIKKQPYGAAQS